MLLIETFTGVDTAMFEISAVAYQITYKHANILVATILYLHLHNYGMSFENNGQKSTGTLF